MRGTLVQVVERAVGAGIIPAYAGNTVRSAIPSSCPRDHPRVCGEHQTNLTNQQTMQGSSPRMRGTLPHHRYDDDSSGIIPAYAGNTAHGYLFVVFHEDHPRVCGEHMPCGARRRPESGSSPRMRGTRNVMTTVTLPLGIIPAYAGNTRNQNVLRLSRGIIPAYAGNTDVADAEFLRHRDHPRVCGEHSNRVGDWFATLGSSPRMRGTRDVCNSGLAVNQGSSPRMRGTLMARLHQHPRAGIIPAYAGNTIA